MCSSWILIQRTLKLRTCSSLLLLLNTIVLGRVSHVSARAWPRFLHPLKHLFDL